MARCSSRKLADVVVDPCVTLRSLEEPSHYIRYLCLDVARRDRGSDVLLPAFAMQLLEVLLPEGTFPVITLRAWCIHGF